MGHIDQIKQEFPHVITVELGGSYGELPPRTTLENTIYIAGAMSRAGYDVANVGLSEARFGLDFIEEREEETGVEYISANLVGEGRQKPLLSPYTLRRVGGLKVGFLGLMDVVTPVPPELSDQALEIRDPIEAAREYVPRLRKKSGLLVVLAYMTLPRAQELAERVDGIDVLFCRSSRAHTQPQKVGNTVIAPGGTRSGHVGELDLTLGVEGVIESWMGEVVRLQELGPRDDEMDRTIREMMNAQARNRLERQRQAREEQEGLDAARRDSLDALREATPPSPPAPAPGSYVGAAACQSCHEEVFSRWSAGPHAAAFATLAETDDWSEARCLRCHTTGFGSVGRSREGLPAPEFWNVQCEACHGPGSGHAAQPGPMTHVAEGVCAACHDEEWSPEFEFTSWRGRLTHGRGSDAGG